MERNNESRNQYNDRTRNQWDQDNNRNQSSDFQQNRSQYPTGMRISGIATAAKATALIRTIMKETGMEITETNA